MNKDVQAEFNELVETFANGLPNKIREIEHLWKALQEKFQPEVLKEFHLKVHDLQGTAGVFGYTTLTEVARHLSKMLTEHQSSSSDKAIFSHEEKTKIKKLLKELNSASLAPDVDFALPVIKSLKETVPPQETKSNKVIYLLENDIEWSKKLTAQVAAFGYELERYKNINTLLDALNNTKPLAILINLDLLIDDAEDSLDEIKNKFLASKIPILFISTKTEFSRRLTAIRLGGIAYLIKPFSIEELTAELDRVFLSHNTSFHILIVDDDEEMSHYFAKILQQAKMTTKEVNNPEEVESALHEFNPDLVLLDLHMPECDGFELASIIRQQKTHENVPIIFLSSEEDKEKQLEAMKSGADDFISKAINPEYLITSIKNRINRYQGLRDIMIKDSLTGAFNNSFTQQMLNNALINAKKAGSSMSVAVIEVDNVRTIKNQFGYLTVDQVLKNLYFMLRNLLPEKAIIGRNMGDKLLVILSNSTPESAKELIDEVRSNFMSVLFSSENQLFNSTFSSGIASYPSYQSSIDLTTAAKEALKQAKEKGRNKVELAPSKLSH